MNNLNAIAFVHTRQASLRALEGAHGHDPVRPARREPRRRPWRRTAR